MVGIPEDELDRSILSEASDAEVEPVLGASVQIHIRVALKFDCQGRRGDYAGCGYVAGWEAAVNDQAVVESDVAAIGVPLGLLLFAVRNLTHPEQLINNARSLLMKPQTPSYPPIPQNLHNHPSASFYVLLPFVLSYSPPPCPYTSLD